MSGIQDQFESAQRDHRAGRLDQAEIAYRSLLNQSSHNPALLNALAILLQAKGDFSGAIDYWTQAVAAQSDLPEALCNLGAAFFMQGKAQDAEHYLRRAIAARPSYLQAYNSLGAVMQQQRNFTAALEAYQKALDIRPDFLDALVNLGSIHHIRGEVEEAIVLYRRTIALDHNFARAHLYLAVALLSQGDFTEGWHEYEWRWQTPDFPSPRVHVNRPQWDGSSLEGRSILLYAEQGFGDSIQFIRFAPIIAQHAARVILACPPELVRLFQKIPSLSQVFTSGDVAPDFDLYSSLLDLPKLLEIHASTIPSPAHYLQADPALIEQCKSKVPDGPRTFKIGICWHGKSQNYLPADAWAPLTKFKDVWVCSLQKDALPGDPSIMDFSSSLSDFADTAALIHHLDLVITVDTAIAHLAGALGKPVWILLRPPIDWRWMHHRNDSPWYPTARLFRIIAGDHWQNELDKMIAGVRELLMSRTF